MKTGRFSGYVGMPQAGTYMIHSQGDNKAFCYIYSVPNTFPTDKTKYIKLLQSRFYFFEF